MSKIALTDVSIRNLKHSPKQVDYWDASLPNFGIRVGPKRKTFIVMSADRTRLKLGTYPDMGLADARKAARERLAERTLGVERPPSPSFEEALQQFLTVYSPQNHRPSTARENKRILERHFLPKLKKKEVGEIKPVEVSRILDSMASTPSEAEHAYRVVRTFFNYCVRRGHVRDSPLEQVEPPAKQSSRDRTLTDEELVLVWKRADEIGYPYGTIVQLLICCGQRTGETAALRWSWIDDTSINLPASVCKNGRASRIPCGTLTKSVLDTVPREGDLLFPARGYTDKPFVGFGVNKISLDKCGVKDFTHHDIRRSYATIMASPVVGAPIHVLEKLLNHSSGVLRGVAAIYNRYSYWDEMVAVTEKYENHLQSLIKKP